MPAFQVKTTPQPNLASISFFGYYFSFLVFFFSLSMLELICSPRLRASRKHYQLQSFELGILDVFFLHYSYSVVSLNYRKCLPVMLHMYMLCQSLSGANAEYIRRGILGNNFIFLKRNISFSPLFFSHVNISLIKFIFPYLSIQLPGGIFVRSNNRYIDFGRRVVRSKL